MDQRLTVATDPKPNPPLLRTLGGAELVSAPDGRVLLGPGKPLGLLVFLALSPSRIASRESLLDLLWSDADPDRGRHALRQAVWQVRQCLGDEAISGKDEVELAIPLSSDHARFLAAAEQGQLEEALDLYTGTFLPAFAVPGGVAFERWAFRERDRLRTTFFRIAETIVRRRLAHDDLTGARQLAERACTLAPHTEVPWRLLLTAMVAAGDYASAALEVDALESWARSESRTLHPATLGAMALVRTRGVRRPAVGPGGVLEAELSGREKEFAALLEGWDECVRGLPRHIHISAPAGLGKTRLLREAETRLRAMGARVLHLRSHPGDREVQYAFAAELARGISELPGAVGIAPGLWSALTSLHSSRVAHTPPASPEDDGRLARALAFREALVAATEEQPLALLMDDVHWLDDGSYRMLEGLLSRLGSTRLLCVTTSRPVPEREPEVEPTRRLELVPFNVSLTREFLIGLGVLPTAETWIEGFAAELHHATTGTPLLVLETLKLALDRGTLLFAHGRWTCPDPAALHAMLERGEALRSRVTALRREEHRLLALLVLIGMPLDADRIGNAAGIDPKAIQGTLESLERRGLVIRALGRYEVAHDEVGAAALAALTPAETASGHLSIGRVLEIGAGNDPILLARAARHFRLGGDAHGVATQFRHAVAAIRKRGDRRSLSVLAAEFLGPDAGPAESRRLVATLPLHVRAGLWSRRRSATAAGVLGVMLFLAAAWLRTAPPPAEARLIVLRRLDSVTVVRGSLEVRSTAWRERQRLTVSGEDQPLSDPVLARSTLRPTVSPDGIRWLFRAGSDNAEGEDIYLRSAQGTRVVAAATGNDSHPRWLQGGMRAAFLTRRWSHDGDDYDIGIVDLSTGEVRDLTPTRDWEEGFSVSPDGVRIAFPRRLRAPGDPLVCRILVDGSEERCTALPGYSGLEVVGWLGNRDLLVTADDESRRVLLRVNPESGERTVAFDGTVSDVVVSPDGRWVACRCEWSGEPPDWYVFPARDPDAARPLSWPGGAVEGVAWQVDQWDRGGMDSLVISAGVVPIRLGGSYRLSAQAFDTRGGRVGLREGEVHWTSSDSTMASIHPVTGELVAHRMGLVRIGASVAGGRSASIMLPVLLPASEASRLLLNEVWDGPGLSQWKSYGEPVPVLATGPDGIRGMTNNGDGSYPSGVHSALTYPAVAGLGIEVLLDAPVKQPQWQAQSLGFTSARRTPFETWDHRWLGPPLIRAYEREACDLGYPSGEGWTAMHHVAMTAAGSRRLLAVGDTLRNGGWHRIRVQIFPDGTCGYAVDGVPRWRSSGKIPLGQLYWIDLPGSSARTMMMVGPLQLWAGVRGDVDWSVLNR